MTVAYKPELVERFPSLREFIAHLTYMHPKSAKVIAAEMDLAPSTLSRKLNPAEGDTQRLNADDIDRWVAATGHGPELAEYHMAKSAETPESRKARQLATVERCAGQLTAALEALKANG